MIDSMDASDESDEWEIPSCVKETISSSVIVVGKGVSEKFGRQTFSKTALGSGHSLDAALTKTFPN